MEGDDVLRGARQDLSPGRDLADNGGAAIQAMRMRIGCGV
jgi:hypothetical protein